jgi:hypothetical protein
MDRAGRPRRREPDRPGINTRAEKRRTTPHSKKGAFLWGPAGEKRIVESTSKRIREK